MQRVGHVLCHRELLDTGGLRTEVNISRQCCYNAMQILNRLIPSFEVKATGAEDIESFCALVCLAKRYIYLFASPNM
jgi:hypothetical protein